MLRGDALVGATVEAEDGDADVGCAVEGGFAGAGEATGEAGVEGDCAGEGEVFGGGEEGEGATHAEAEGEDGG